jgi:hypothetical protein
MARISGPRREGSAGVVIRVVAGEAAISGTALAGWSAHHGIVANKRQTSHGAVSVPGPMVGNA